jgi:hypothetical protein
MTAALYYAGMIALVLGIAASVVIGRRAWGDPARYQETLRGRYGLTSRRVGAAMGVAMYGRRSDDERIQGAARDLAGWILQRRAQSQRDEAWRWRWYRWLQGAALVLALGGGAASAAFGQVPPGPLLLALVISVLRLVHRPWVDRNLRRAAGSTAGT